MVGGGNGCSAVAVTSSVSVAVQKPKSINVQKVLLQVVDEAKKIAGVSQVFQFDDNVAVVAKNTWIGFSAKKLIEVEWSSDEDLLGTPVIDAQLFSLLKGSSFKNLKKTGESKK